MTPTPGVKDGAPSQPAIPEPPITAGARAVPTTRRPPPHCCQNPAKPTSAAHPWHPRRVAQLLLHSPAPAVNGALSPKPALPGTEPNPVTPTLPTMEPAAAPSTNTAGVTELFFGQWTKGDHSRVIERPKSGTKSGTKSHESGQRETPGAVPATGCLPKQPTTRTSTPQRQLWEECKNTPTRCGSATPSGPAPLGISAS